MRIFTTPQLDEIPEPSYLLKPFLVDGGLTVLFGPSGTFKTFIGIGWALSVATESSSVDVAAEGAASLRQRVAAWRAAGPAIELNAAWAPTAVNLLAKNEVDQLAAAIGALETPPSAPGSPVDATRGGKAGLQASPTRGRVAGQALGDRGWCGWVVGGVWTECAVVEQRRVPATSTWR